jgi:acyl-homoserine lactone acylase PvdQ
MARRPFRILVLAAALVASTVLGGAGTPATAAPPGPGFAAGDYCLGQCGYILPPGENGNATLTELLAFKAFGIRPAHFSDQLGKYQSLVWNYAGLTDAQLAGFFNDNSFGVPGNQVESTFSPRSDVTIVRDKRDGVPHIFGSTRSGTMFGAGYAGANDRLFVMDVFRHLGRGQLTSFVGGAPGNQEFEQRVYAAAPYTEADLQAQFDALAALGPDGLQAQADIRDWVAGVNAYIAQSVATLSFPGEYPATGHLLGPEPWQVTDVVATAGVVGGFFGGGGGAEMASALALIEARARYGTAAGTQVWQAFRSAEDPEAPTTVHNGQSFPYGTPPLVAGTALPDRGSVLAEAEVTGATGTGSASAQAGAGTVPRSGDGGTGASTTDEASTGILDGGVLPQTYLDSPTPSMSNALLVSGAHTASGHPVAVFGPQTGYFAPQLWVAEELQGPGISARGVAFAGLNFEVLLGRGQDYAWSATSAASDLTDTYAVDLCDPSGGAPALAADHYLFHGQCLPMETLSVHNSWSPNLADSTASGSYTLTVRRTKYGLVTHRGTVAGRPVAFTRLRSTYRREVASAAGFSLFGDPTRVNSAQSFQQAAYRVGFAFNFFYADAHHIAYLASGDNPVRPPGADANLPTRADPAYEWAGWNPDTNAAQYTPIGQHPQVVDQDWLTSWNNKQAPGYNAADGNFSFNAVFRSQPLDDGIRALLAGGGTATRAGLTAAMERAALTDLVGDKVLPLMLRVIGTAPVTDPALSAAVGELSAWVAGGALRHSSGPGSAGYADAHAIQVLDAWWPLFVQAAFGPSLGSGLFAALAAAEPVAEPPSHVGSAFQHGWGGYASKDLRAVLGDAVQAPLPQRFCGSAAGGTPEACRAVLLSSLQQALAVPATQVYPGDADCAAGDQFCHDSIIHQPMGGITQERTHWQNRPTFQQVVEFPAGRGDNVANLAAGRPASASSVEWGLFYSLPAANAVDGDLGTRWGSGWSDPQWLRVDLGPLRQVGRVVLNWEAAYGRAYRIEVSDNGTDWRTAYSTAAGRGGVEVIQFAPTQARYVRMYGTQRGTQYGYSLWDMGVYAQ